MLIIVHFRFEVATKIVERFAIFDNWQKFVDEEFGLKLQRTGEKFLNPKVAQLSTLIPISANWHHLVKQFKRS